ncbi:hypothetical protein ABH935_009215 [Catenulispora sp. GAS73]
MPSAADLRAVLLHATPYCGGRQQRVVRHETVRLVHQRRGLEAFFFQRQGQAAAAELADGAERLFARRVVRGVTIHPLAKTFLTAPVRPAGPAGAITEDRS